MNEKKKMHIGPMVIASVIMFVVFALIGAALCIWFSEEARPAVKTIRTAAAWTKWFAGFYFGGCLISLLYTILMTFMGGAAGAYKMVHWLINVLVTVFIGIILAVLFYILAPTKDAMISIISAIAIFLQGLLIFFVASFWHPKHWGGYNPFRK